MAKLVVITGGAHAGKTAVVRALAALGYDVLPEAAYEVIDELNDMHGGPAGQVAWRRENLVEFQRLITRRQHGREAIARASDAPYVFCDRGALDGHAYCIIDGAPWPDDLHELVADSTYAHAFVLDTLTPFDPRSETGRMDTAEESGRAAELLEEIYQERAGAITRVPEMPVAERVEFVLRRLKMVP